MQEVYKHIYTDCELGEYGMTKLCENMSYLTKLTTLDINSI